MESKDRIIQILYEYENAGLIECDAEKVLALVDEDVIGIGIGEQGMVRSKADIERIISQSIKNDRKAKYSFECTNILVKIFDEKFAIMCADVQIKCVSDEKISQGSFMQSLNLTYKKGDWLICALHASPLKMDREGIEAMPLAIADKGMAQIRSEIRSEAFELIGDSFSGGILGTYVCDGCYPLYFANDTLINSMQYTREEFLDLFQEDATKIIHADDKECALSEIAKNVEKNEDYEMCFRILRKDGSSMWIIDHARKTTTPDGRDVILGIITDISELVSMQESLEHQTAILQEQAAKLEEQTMELSAQNEELIAQKEALEEQAKALTISEERFRIALEKTSNIIFDYDIISGNIMHSSAPKKSLDFITNIKDARDTLVIGGEIIGEYLTAFNEAFKAIENGANQSECVVKVRLATSREIWNKISMTGISDASGRAVRAIGMIEDITKQKEAEIAYSQEEQYRQAILSDAMASYVVNFKKCVFESCKANFPNIFCAKRNEPYDNFLCYIKLACLDEKDRTNILNTFSKANIMESYERGITELKLEYKYFSDEGRAIWVQNTIRLMMDAATSELKGFLYLTNIDKKKREELELMRKSEIDPMTGVCNKITTEVRICERLLTLEGINSGVFMMLDVDYFKEINDTYGHPFGDKVLIETANALKKNFRETDIIGRMGGDEFCVFFTGMRSKVRIEQAANDVCEKVRQIFVDKNGDSGVTCSIGIATCDGVGKTFEKIYDEADRALYVIKKKGRNGYIFYDDISQ